MKPRFDSVRELHKLFRQPDAMRFVRESEHAEKIEKRWTRKAEQEFKSLESKFLDDMLKDRKPDLEFALDEFLMEHSLDTMKEAAKKIELPEKTRLAAPPKGKVPRGIREIMDLWDAWNKKGIVGKRQKAIADKVKKLYLKKIQSVWDKYALPFRQGKVGPDEVRKAVQKATAAPRARTMTIVQTETTYYYNETRRRIYDQSPDVTHYLFMAIRDHRTTRICRTRHGKVFKKGTELFEKNVPPCHYNCRSEILPLTPSSTSEHRRLVNDKNRRPIGLEPLLPGWKPRKQ